MRVCRIVLRRVSSRNQPSSLLSLIILFPCLRYGFLRYKIATGFVVFWGGNLWSNFVTLPREILNPWIIRRVNLSSKSFLIKGIIIKKYSEQLLLYTQFIISHTLSSNPINGTNGMQRKFTLYTTFREFNFKNLILNPYAPSLYIFIYLSIITWVNINE